MVQTPNDVWALGDDEAGFTLIELMVVVLIIAILIAIAIPTFLGAKSRAQDKAAQSSLRNALTNAKTIYTDTDSYSGTTVSALATAEPSLIFVPPDTPSTGSKEVSVNSQPNYVIFAALSSTQSCYVVGDWSSGGTFFAKVSGACTANAASAVLGASATTPTAPAPTSNTATSDVWVAAF